MGVVVGHEGRLVERRRVWRGHSPSNFICQNNKNNFFPVQNSFFVFSGKVESGQSSVCCRLDCEMLKLTETHFNLE